jgi:hypothetical protein
MDKLPCHPPRTEKQTGYPEAPWTLGEHLRKVRLDRGLWQKQVAREIGCSDIKWSLQKRKHGEAQPRLEESREGSRCVSKS